MKCENKPDADVPRDFCGCQPCVHAREDLIEPFLGIFAKEEIGTFGGHTTAPVVSTHLVSYLSGRVAYTDMKNNLIRVLVTDNRKLREELYQKLLRDTLSWRLPKKP